MSEETPQVTLIDNDGEHFAFGEAKPVLATNLADYTGVFAHYTGEYYNPPVSTDGLAKLLRANPHHESAIFFKRNMQLKWLEPNDLISSRDARYLTLDWQVFFNMYLQVFTDRLGNITRLKRLPAMNMRKKLDGSYCLLTPQHLTKNHIDFKPGEVIHINEADVSQDIYGVPQYLGGMQSVLLSEAATLFRRSYFINGNHAGYILLTYDLPEGVNQDLANKIKAGRAPGNFSNYFIGAQSKNGQRGENLKDKVQVLPIGEINQKDDYERIKKMTLLEIFGMHRLQPALAAMIPDSNAAFGDIEKISRVYYENEVVPMQQPLLEINEYLPSNKQIRFKEPAFMKEAD